MIFSDDDSPPNSHLDVSSPPLLKPFFFGRSAASSPSNTKNNGGTGKSWFSNGKNNSYSTNNSDNTDKKQQIYSLLNSKSSHIKIDQQGLRSLLKHMSNGDSNTGSNISTTQPSDTEYTDDMEEFDVKTKYYYKPYTYSSPSPHQSLSRSNSTDLNTLDDHNTNSISNNHHNYNHNHSDVSNASSIYQSSPKSTTTPYFGSVINSPFSTSAGSGSLMGDKRGNYSPLMSFISENHHDIIDDETGEIDHDVLMAIAAAEEQDVEQSDEHNQDYAYSHTCDDSGILSYDGTTTTNTNSTGASVGVGGVNTCHRCRHEMDNGSSPNSESHSSPPSFSLLEFISQQWSSISSKVSMVAINESGAMQSDSSSDPQSIPGPFNRLLTFLFRLIMIPFLLSVTIPFFIGVVCFLIILSVLSVSTLTAFCFLLMTTPFFIIGIVGLLYIATFIINGRIRGGHKTIVVLGVSIYELIVKSITSITNYVFGQYRKIQFKRKTN